MIPIDNNFDHVARGEHGGFDVVYTWVDGAWPGYQALLANHTGRPVDLNPERFRDPYECLRYSLRSLDRFAPWVRNVYFFTCRPQVPTWLNRDHPRVRIVHHDEVVRVPELLPTFNSNVIESFLHLLPGLSDRFVYFNDDYFLGALTSVDDFLLRDGRMRVFGTVCGEHLRFRVYEKQWLSLGLLEHGPLLIDRLEWAAMQAEVPDEIATLYAHRFRQPDDLRPDRLYRWHLLKHRRRFVRAEPFWRYLRTAAFHKIKPGAIRQRAALDRLAKRAPKFICLNDDLGPDADPAVVQVVRDFLQRQFPEPSCYELGVPR